MDLSDLIARVEKATGPDREIDAHIGLLLDGAGTSAGFYQWRGVQPKGYDATPYEFALKRAPAYSASLDAALALVERVMEGCSPLVGVDRSYGFDNDIPGSEETPRWNAWCYGKSAEHPTSPALALLLAMLRAKQAEQS